MSKLHEFTGVGSIAPIDGAGIGFQPRPAMPKRRTAVSSLLGDDDERLPKKQTKKVESMVESTTLIETLRECQRELITLAEEYQKHSEDWMSSKPHEQAVYSGFSKRLSSLAQRLKVESVSAPVQMEHKVTPGFIAPMKIESVAQKVELRGFYGDGPTVTITQPMTESEALTAANAVASSMVVAAEVPQTIIEGAGMGEALMRGGILPPPEVGSTGKFMAAVHHMIG